MAALQSMTTGDRWQGARRTRARAAITALLPQPCAYCGRIITPDDPPTTWHLDHNPPRALLAEDQWDNPDYHRVACAHCNTSKGATLGNVLRGRRRNAVEAFSVSELNRPAAPVLIRTHSAGNTPGMPRFMNSSHPNAAGSLWDVVGPWVAERVGIRLRPWQERLARRAHEVDSRGNLLWRTVVVSTPRQSGKSWLLKAVAIARAAHPDLFGGEPQLVVHTARNHQAARRIHSQAWGWARGAGLLVLTAQGSERVVWGDGSSWDALTLSSVYGASANLVMLDEVWDVSPEDYREGLRPTQVARRMPQLWALSTAHRRASGLMLDLMGLGRADRGRVLLADWGAEPGMDETDPDVWAQVSPHWDEQRGLEMGDMVGTQGFAEQWLNVWPDQSDVGRWLPKRASDAAAGVVGEAPSSACVGVECTPDGRGWAVAAAWPDRRDLVRARVWLLDGPAEVQRLVGGRRVWAHPAVIKHPGLRWKQVEQVNVSVGRAATTELRDVVRAGLLTVSGVPDEMWAGVRTAPADGGESIYAPKSVGDVHGLKALSWAVWAVQSERHQMGLVL